MEGQAKSNLHIFKKFMYHDLSWHELYSVHLAFSLQLAFVCNLKLTLYLGRSLYRCYVSFHSYEGVRKASFSHWQVNIEKERP